jgi:mono/diheme cytochrome c family protein
MLGGVRFATLHGAFAMTLKSTAVVLAVAAIAGAGLAAQGTPATARDMRSHFVQVAVVHEAVIRGDLQAVHAAATMLAKSDAAGLPAALVAQHQAMRSLAERLATASDVSAAASGTAALLGACGECHRVAGAMPGPALPSRPTVGEAVGHMLDHQRAADQMMQGLVLPSPALWNMGAQALRTAPLGTGKLPKDPKLTSEVASSEKRVHALAEQAATATEPKDRVAVYGQLLATCATCHSVHSTIWGPTKK